jgi:hypothetical protein
MTTAINAELPNALLKEANAFIETGGARDLNHLLAEALRRFLESHTGQLLERFIREDIGWGLHGSD